MRDMAPQAEFSKWQGLGNDYIIVATVELPFKLTPERSVAICDRHFGIGGDGILAWGPSRKADFKLEIHNPDGSCAEMCGNGIRMLARFLVDWGYAEGRRKLLIETDAGPMPVNVRRNGLITVNMGVARLGGPGIKGYAGVPGESEAVGAWLEAGMNEYQFTFVDMGNPHCVIESDDLDNLDIRLLGPEIENHALFPNRTNVEFMNILGPSEVEMRVWERGVGETSACGTGACAVAVAAHRAREMDSPITVHLPGGDLVVDVDQEMNVVMSGPAEEIYSGTMSDDLVKRIKEL